MNGSLAKLSGQAPARGRRLVSVEVSVQQRLCVTVSLALSAIIAAVLLAVLWFCDEHFIYSLDDPYISLSLARHLAAGHYGINASEAASPSSSILYPLLLAVFAWSSWHEYVPLVLNALAAIATSTAFAAAAAHYRIIGDHAQTARGTLLLVTLCFAIDTVGLVFLGLEHSLHALTSVVLVFGLARAMEENKVPPYLLAAIVLAPLWRFEGLALALLAIAALAATRQFRSALIGMLGIAVTLSAFMIAMHVLGLPLLPSSVLTKSKVAREIIEASPGLIGFVSAALPNAIHHLNLEAAPVILLTVLVLGRPLQRCVAGGAAERTRLSGYRETVFSLVIAGALVAHILFGAWGWFSRYVAYAVALGTAGSLVLWHRPIARMVAFGRPTSIGFAVTGLIYLGIFYVWATVQTPTAAREIFQQQYQMHRFVVDFYRRPVAVNDLGWVGYGNDNYVLDLWGLGSEEARQARARGEADGAWLERLVRRHDVGLVMIYDKWFAGQIPQDWRRLAVLRIEGEAPVAVSDAAVSFYATSPNAAAAAIEALHGFAAHTVPGSTLTVFDNGEKKG